MIRRATPADASAICAIWNPIIRDTTITFTTTLKTPATLAKDIATAPFFVAEQDGTVHGFVTWAPFRSGPGYAETLEHSIHLSEAARGQGLGRALMDRCEAEVRDSGGHSLIAGLSGENSGGIAFHRAMGFEQVGHLPQVGVKFGRRLDLVLMQKTL